MKRARCTKLTAKRLFVVFQNGFPSRLEHDYAPADLLRIEQELSQPNYGNGQLVWSANRRITRRVAIGGLVHALDQEAGILKFNRKKESRRNVDALNFDALSIGAAGSYLVGPEIPTALVRLAVQKIMIVLPHEEQRVVSRIRAGLRIVRVDGQDGRAWGAGDGAAGDLRKRERDGLRLLP